MFRRALIASCTAVLLLLAFSAHALADNTDCLACHESSSTGVATAKADFRTVAPVDRTTACIKCHWEAPGGHPYHNASWNCGACHSWGGAIDYTAVPTVWTSAGFFNAASSAVADASQLHVIHSNPRWAGSLTYNNRECESCHAAAACTACHEEPLPFNHTDHTWDADTATYTAGYGPASKRFGSGTNIGNEREMTVASGLTCSNTTCHDISSGSNATTLTDDSSASVVYGPSGAWGSSSTSGYLGNSYHRSNWPGATAQIVFRGQKIEFVTDRSLYRGIARISLDGSVVATADLYAATTEKQYVAYASPTLASGTHTLTVEVLGTKNTSARDVYVFIDAFRVYPVVDTVLTPCVTCHPDRGASHGYDAATHQGTSCGDCHDQGLGQEHIDKHGLTCSTCHSSTSSEVQSAIADRDATCSRCHALHTLDNTFCYRCHTSGLRSYPGRAVAEAGKHVTATSSSAALTKYPGAGTDDAQCVNCHTSHKSTRASGNQLCYTCHDDASIVHTSTASYQGNAVYAQSGHGAAGSAMTSRTVVITAETTGFAAWEGTSEPTPSSPGRAIPSSRLGGLDAIDSTRTVTGLATTTGAYDYQMYRFKLPYAASQVDSMTLRWVGFGEEYTGYPVSVYVWDYTLNSGAGGWSAVTSRQMADDTLVRFSPTKAKNADAFGNVYVMAKAQKIVNTELSAAPSAVFSADGSVTVSWGTYGLCDTWVDYGLTDSYGLTRGTGTRSTSHSVSLPALSGTYHYRVRSESKWGEQYVSPDATFTVPGTVLTPIGDAVDQGPVAEVFAWSTPDPALDPFTYRLHVWSDGGYQYWGTWDTATSVTLQLNVDDSYHWQVESRDKDGVTHLISAIDDFGLYSPSGTCPFLFSWDGTKFVFEADEYSTGKLGAKTSKGYTKPNPRDYHVLATTPAVKDGALEYKLVEERHETDYLDQLKLYALDVPADRDVYSERAQAETPAFNGLSTVLHTVATTLTAPPKVTWVNTAEDVTAKVAASDGDYVQLSNDRNLDFTYNTLELDLGDVRDAPQVKLVIDGLTTFPNLPAGTARSATFGARTKLEVQDASGNWVSVPSTAAILPKPPEFTRPFVLDISKIWASDSRKVRLTFLFKTRIDALLLDTTADEPVTITELPLQSADLQAHGFDDVEGPDELYDYVYGSVIGQPDYLPGNYTRFGDVMPLLDSVDDEFVIYGGGDELTLRFTPPASAAEGMNRRYLLWTDGYYKDRKADITHTVEPLPFAAMSNFPYAATEHYPDDADHNAYRAEWNTRVDGVEAGGISMQSFSDLLGSLGSVFGLSAPATTEAASAGPATDTAVAAADFVPDDSVHRSLNTNYVGLELSYESSPTVAGQCSACHAVHGAVDGRTGSPLPASLVTREYETCTGQASESCHAAANSVSGVNVARGVSGTDPRTHHDVQADVQATTGSRIACSDCHDPHKDNASSKYGDPDNVSTRMAGGVDKYVGPNGEVYALVGALHDGVAPVISGTSLDPVASGYTFPTITWSTDESATSWVDYGLTTSYELGSVGSDVLAKSHSAVIPGLIDGTTYHYRVRTGDALGNVRLGADLTYKPVRLPSTPTATPIPSVVGPISVTATWTPSTCPDGHPVQYYVEFTGNYALNSGWISATSYSAYLGQGNWYWRVRARDASDTQAVSAWSDWSYVLIDSPPDSGTCPFLFSWDGTKFVFEADEYAAGKLAIKTSKGFQPPNPRDYHVLATTPSVKDGALEYKLVEERRETDYLDQLKMYTLDVPADRDVYAERAEANSPVPDGLQSILHTVSRNLSAPPKVTWVNTGEDVTSKVSASDGDYVQLNNDRNLDFTYQTLELDLGDVRDAPQVKLVVDALSTFPNAPVGTERSATFGARTKLEVQDAAGNWVSVPSTAAILPKPPEFTRPFVIDISKIWASDSRKLRLTFLFKTRVDALLVDTTADEPVTVTEVPLQSAALSAHGFDAKEGPSELFDYVYGDVIGQPDYMPGNFTRFGDVTPLLESIDDEFVIYGGGDELTLRFTPPVAAAAHVNRRYLLWTDGYYKDLKADVTHTVEPLPFAAMSNFPYADGEQYPSDAEHDAYRAEWNTRVDGVEATAAASPDASSTSDASTSSASAVLAFFGDMFGRVERFVASIIPHESSVRVAESEPVLHYSVDTDLLSLRTTRYGATASVVTTVAQGWASTGATPTPSAPGSLRSDAATRTAAQDSQYWITDLASADKSSNWQLVKFQLPSDAKVTLRDVFLKWRGHGEPTPSYPVTLYLWNYDTGSWDSRTTTDAATDMDFGVSDQQTNSAMCLRCHDGTPPSGVTVPSSVVTIGPAWASSGVDAHGDRKGSGYSGGLALGYTVGSSGLPCATCHDSHGNANLYHIADVVNGRSVVVTNSAQFQNLCLSCHTGTVADLHAQCNNCHYGDHWDGPYISGGDCSACHKHGTKYYHPATCHGCMSGTGFSSF